MAESRIGKEKDMNLIKREVRFTASDALLAFKEKLDALNMRYTFAKGFVRNMNGKSVVVDFYLPKPYYLCIDIANLRTEEQKREASLKKMLIAGRSKRNSFRYMVISEVDAYALTKEKISAALSPVTNDLVPEAVVITPCIKKPGAFTISSKTIIPWGRHKGTCAASLVKKDPSYLKYVEETFDGATLSPKLRKALGLSLNKKPPA